MKDVGSYRSADDNHTPPKAKFKASGEASNLERNRTRYSMEQFGKDETETESRRIKIGEDIEKV